MTSAMKYLIMLVVWLAFSAIAYFGFIEPCCPDGDTAGSIITDATATTTIDSARLRYPITFRTGSAAPFTGQQYVPLRDSLLAIAQGNGQILEITGLYFEREAAPAGFPNMGFARADSVRQLFRGQLPEDRIKLRAQTILGEMPSDSQSFSGVTFDFIEAEELAEPQEEKVEIEELADRVIVRFPYNSTERTVDPAVDTYLAGLARRLQQTEETVLIIGHTDDKGGDDFNLRLGLQRAEALQRILLQDGIDASRVRVETRGETQPVDTNDTEAGRQNNRRAEIRLVAPTSDTE